MNRFKRLRFIRNVFAFAVAALLAACVGSTARTSVDRVAKAPDLPNAPYSNYLIVGVAARGTLARQFEEAVVAELADGNTRAYGYRRLAERADVSEDEVREIVAEKGIDAVLVSSARLVDSEVKLKKGRTDVQAQSIGGSLIDFFRYGYEETTSPSRADLKFDIQFVTDVYDADSNDRVYTMTSTTLHAETTYEVILDESRAIAERLKKDDMIE